MKFKMNTIFICIIFLLLGILLASIIFPNKCVEGYDLKIGPDGCFGDGQGIPMKNADSCLQDLAYAAENGTLCDAGGGDGNIRNILRKNIEQGNTDLIDNINEYIYVLREPQQQTLLDALDICSAEIQLEYDENLILGAVREILPGSAGGTLTVTGGD